MMTPPPGNLGGLVSFPGNQSSYSQIGVSFITSVSCIVFRFHAPILSFGDWMPRGFDSKKQFKEATIQVRPKYFFFLLRILGRFVFLKLRLPRKSDPLFLFRKIHKNTCHTVCLSHMLHVWNCYNITINLP